ncbi:Hypothetical predicted protein [Olea europaea subsp. europaea]|uniref:Uncharacterized protein n=1 Tax=Olea europaea subsp. europaea TaxID=158383 RepID=A0A8S0T5K9_OLEEU|nr:Hypothetical predicted protein [Olea europaea subsp. europaea]
MRIQQKLAHKLVQNKDKASGLGFHWTNTCKHKQKKRHFFSSLSKTKLLSILASRLLQKMGGEINNRRLPYFSGCMSPSCVTVHEEYARIHISRGNNRGRRLKKLVRKIVNESKSIYEPSKPVTFQYDAVSYSQNFDEGLHKEDYPQVFQQFKCRVVK